MVRFASNHVPRFLTVVTAGTFVWPTTISDTITQLIPWQQGLTTTITTTAGTTVLMAYALILPAPLTLFPYILIVWPYIKRSYNSFFQDLLEWRKCQGQAGLNAVLAIVLCRCKGFTWHTLFGFAIILCLIECSGGKNNQSRTVHCLTSSGNKVLDCKAGDGGFTGTLTRVLK